MKKVVLMVLAVFSLAMINPDFTPSGLVRQADLILQLHIDGAKDGKLTATVVKVMKGKFDAKQIAFNLKTSTPKNHGEDLEKFVQSETDLQGMFYVGSFGNGGDADPASPKKGYLALGGQEWDTFSTNNTGDFEMIERSNTMGTTFNGGVDMLARATECMLADPDEKLPIKEGMTWSGGISQIGQVDGKVHAAMPVDLIGDGALSLFVSSEGGDHLFKWDTKTSAMVDVTQAVKLTSKSKVAAWLDVNASGRMDLMSYDGDALTIFTQQPDGTFQAGDKLLQKELKDGCLAIIPIDSGKPGHPGAIIGTKSARLLWSSDEPGKVSFVGAPYNGPDLGAPTACLAGDLDGDGLPDIIQIFEKGSLIYRGKAPGQFADPKPSDVSSGGGAGGAFFGDFAAGGLLDIFTVCENSSSRLWNNRGSMKFVDTMAMTGELSYKCSSGAIGGNACDINNDGRQDVFFFYAGDAPHIFFNRGFRSFGQANDIDNAMHPTAMPNATDGEQAGAVADFNADGSQDMAIVQKTGAVWMFFGDATPKIVRAYLSSKGPQIGPVTVTGWKGTRCLGAWNVTAGTSEALIGVPDSGKVTLKWQFPGQAAREITKSVENDPIRVDLNAPK